MLYAHNIHVSVFCKPEDDEEKIKKALLDLIPYNLEKEKIEFKIESAEISDDRKIRIFEIIMLKQKHTNGFIESIFSKLGKVQLELIKSQIDSRVDEKPSFLRLDKERLFNGEYILTDSGNCVHIRMAIAAYPSNKASAKNVVSSIIDDFLSIK